MATSSDAKRHIRELSQLFCDVNEIGEKTVEEFLKWHKKRKYLKQSLRRLEKKGFILQRNKRWIVTKIGRKFLSKYLITKENISDESWDGKWRLISFDVPVRKNSKRFQIRTLLKEFNFYQLQKSVWVCPNRVGEKLWKLFVDYELDKYCSAMVVEIIEGDAKLRKYYKLSQQRQE